MHMHIELLEANCVSIFAVYAQMGHCSQVVFSGMYVVALKSTAYCVARIAQ
jgi:hypothetical protein